MTITIKDLRERIKDLPDDMPVVLGDLNDDSDEAPLYELEEKSMGVEEAKIGTEGEEYQDVFLISFANKHLPSLQ